MDNILPLVSVIIPTHNSAKMLKLCLKAVREQTYPNIEIIVVDKYSTDDTRQIAERFGVRFFESNELIDGARNMGLIKAKGKYVISLDSDIEMSPGVVEECMIKASQGLEIITFPEAIKGEGFWAKCRALEAKCYLGDDTIEAPRFFKKEILIAIDQYQTSDAEDWDLRERLLEKGYKISRVKAATAHHEGKVSPLRRVRKKFIYTGHIISYIKRHRKKALSQFPLIRTAYYKNWKLLAKDPIHSLGFMFMKSLETIAVISGIAVHSIVKQKRR